ncbi:MAG: ketoacyl-ACP synthase III [Chlamydiia bacterium]|nr:ketoacyl-ACP synthase III [Chlamydiia bacterium]
MTAKMIGCGSYLPKKILSNSDLEKMVETSDEWIVERTGMRERRLAAKGEFPSTMGLKAAKKALKNAKLKPEDVDLIIVATMTPDYITPSTAALIQAELGAPRAAAVDIQAACSGYLYALSMAKAHVEAGMANTVLLIATEKMSAFIDYTDRNTCVLFGDGASASLISNRGSGLSINALHLGADGKEADLMKIPAGGSREPSSCDRYFRMNGREVFKHAVRRMAESAETCLSKASLTTADLKWIVPHQANKRIMTGLAKKFHFPEEKIYQTLHKYGNTSASSVAIALDELLDQEPLNPGDNILLVTFGVGLTWGAALLSAE